MNTRLTQRTLAVVALVLAMTAATPVFARSTASLTIQGVAAHGRAVTITVANSSSRPVRGTVVIRALLMSGPVGAAASVSVPPGQSKSVRMDLPETVKDVLPLGVVVDDGVPF